MKKNGTSTIILVAKDFSKSPAGRFKTDGPFSGQHLREDFIIPALNKFDKVIVNLDGTIGYGSSFLEEAFKGLDYRLIIESSDMSILEEARKYWSKNTVNQDFVFEEIGKASNEKLVVRLKNNFYFYRYYFNKWIKHIYNSMSLGSGRCCGCGISCKNYNKYYRTFCCKKCNIEDVMDGLYEHVMYPNGRENNIY